MLQFNTDMTELKLIASKPEVDNIYTFQFTTGGLTWRAGQYFALVMPQVSDRLEQYEHWFSISSAPYQQQIHITVRKSDSPFKQALFNMLPGDRIAAHTIDGDFAWPTGQNPIFIAGGIGITPFISMLRQREFEQQSLAAHIYYFNRNAHIAFEPELSQLTQSHPELSISYLFEKPLSLEPILKLHDHWENSIALVAGPVPMVDRLGQALLNKSIPHKRDYYFGYDVTNF